MNLSENLKRIRKEHNLSQEQLAEKLNVSRQSVSKWESGLAYPEMDKVLQLCKLFNLNIDELLNQNIKEIDKTKQSKNNINKIIEGFFEYVTKTINLFSSIKFKDKIKCIVEQLFIIGILFLIFSLVGSLFGSIFGSLFSFLSYNAYYIILNILRAIYLLVSIILGMIILFHTFKIRYLDYYVIANDNFENNIKSTNDEEKSINRINDSSQNKREKIIIRDPKHSEYKFITNLLKIFLFFVKAFATFIGLCFSGSFIFLFILFVLSFMFIKTGLLFIGFVLSIISCLLVNFIILIWLYNFITTRKNLSLRLPILFVISLVLSGVGIGMVLSGFTSFDIINVLNSENIIEDEYLYKMKENLFINDHYGRIYYNESDNDDVKLVFSHSNFNTLEIDEVNNSLILYPVSMVDNELKVIRQVINDLNNKQFIDYSNYRIDVYTTKENIDKLKNNLTSYYKQQYEEQDTINNLYDTIYNQNKTINEKNDEITEKNNKIYELENSLDECNDLINDNKIEKEE